MKLMTVHEISLIKYEYSSIGAKKLDLYQLWREFRRKGNKPTGSANYSSDQQDMALP